MIRLIFGSIALVMLSMVDAAAETRTLNFSGFEEVDVASGMRVSIKQANSFQVTATGRPEDLKRLQVKQAGKSLRFSMPPNFQFQKEPISLAITMPVLRSLGLSGGSTGNFTMDIGSQSFKSGLSGGAELSGQIRGGNIELELSGGSQVTLSGSGQRVSINGSGGSVFQLGALTVTLLNASLSGGSEATYHKNAKLGAVDSSGGSQLRPGR